MPGASRINWSLTWVVATWLLSTALGGAGVVWEERLNRRLDEKDLVSLHEQLDEVKKTVGEIRARVPDAGTYDVKFASQAQQIDSLRSDLKILSLQWQKDHNQLLARRIVAP